MNRLPALALALACLSPPVADAAPPAGGPWIRPTTATAVYDARLVGDDAADASQGAKLAPTDEKPPRIRLAQIERGSVFDQLGFADGDVLVSIDGRPITTEVQALELHEALRSNDRISVVLERRGRPLTLTFLRERFEAPMPAAAPAGGRADGSGAGPADDGAVRATGPGAYTVDGARWDAMLADGGALARGARLVPAVKDGAVIGFKLYAVRAGSWFDRLGLKNGDVLRAVNGLPLTSPQEALEAYEKVRDAPLLTVGIDRADQPLTLRYTIER